MARSKNFTKAQEEYLKANFNKLKMEELAEGLGLTVEDTQKLIDKLNKEAQVKKLPLLFDPQNLAKGSVTMTAAQATQDDDHRYDFNEKEYLDKNRDHAERIKSKFHPE